MGEPGSMESIVPHLVEELGWRLTTPDRKEKKIPKVRG